MKKVNWITNLRAIACLLIILLHVVGGYIHSSEIVLQQYTIRWWIDNVLIQLFVRIGVPIFIMISGALLLNSNKEISLKKIINYIFKTLIIILLFGFIFSLIEEIFTNKIYNIPKQIIDIILNIFEQKSWDVLWYLYMLIGLYILTPILRSFVNNSDDKTYIFVLICLFVFSSVIPTINYIFNINITTFYLSGFIYIFYYMMGHFITYKCNNIKNKKIIYIILFGGILGFLSLLIFKNLYYDKTLNNINFISFVALISISIFYLFSKYNKKENKILSSISKYSLGIYLVHTFWLNIIYKGLKIYPNQFYVGIGELLFWILTFILSYISCLILYRLPIIKKIFKLKN